MALGTLTKANAQGADAFQTKIVSQAFSEASEAKTTHNDSRTTPARIAMSPNATLGVETRLRKRTREREANAGDAIPGLLNDVVVTHVLRSEHFDDPADLARLPAVSRGMRDAVTATGLEFEELVEEEQRMFKRIEAPATARSSVA